MRTCISRLLPACMVLLAGCSSAARMLQPSPDGGQQAPVPQKADLALSQRAVQATFPPITQPPPLTDPSLLSQSGLYADIVAKQLNPGVLAYKPQYELWADGAQKSRWMLLPQGQTIDTSNMDRWKFPVGTKLWKEFRKDGKRIETRLQWKRTQPSTVDDGWDMITYLWDDDEKEARRITDGQLMARGTTHDVPQESDCPRCHRVENERPLGFSAIQLSGARAAQDGINLRYLANQHLLSAPPANPDGYTLPGDATAQAALGYLHANCGGCHAYDSQVYMEVAMALRLEVGKLGTVAMTPAYVTTVNQLTMSTKQGMNGQPRIKPGDYMHSAVWIRMGIRDTGPEALQMPPLATTQVDETGRAQVASWIQALP